MRARYFSVVTLLSTLTLIGCEAEQQQQKFTAKVENYKTIERKIVENGKSDLAGSLGMMMLTGGISMAFVSEPKGALRECSFKVTVMDKEKTVALYYQNNRENAGDLGMIKCAALRDGEEITIVKKKDGERNITSGPQGLRKSTSDIKSGANLIIEKTPC